MESDVIQRIKEIIRVNKISKLNFANVIGVKQNTLSNYLLEQRKPSNEFINSILSAYPDISAEWLLRGEGEMYRGQAATTIPANGIPLIPIEAMAGVFTDNNSVGITPEMCEYYTVPSFKGADFLITIKGDSMTPRYFGGDIMACKKLSLTDIFFQWGKVYVLDTEQGVLIKKVQKSTDDAHITLVSENKDYGEFDIPKKAIYHIALVIGTIHVE